MRIQQERPVKIFETLSNRYFGGQTKDISATGLKLELPLNAPVSLGETLNIHVGLSGDGTALANRRQMMPARVMWMHREADFRQGKLYIGVEFLSGINVRANAA